MKDNRNDGAIERNYAQKWRFLIAERQLVKAKKHPKFRFVQDFHPFHCELGHGELGHLDCRCLGKDQIVGSKSRRCLVAMLDARARLAWAEAADDLKSLSVMFAALKSLNLLNAEYGIWFEAALMDNGAEAASRGNAAGHPMERLLGELGIKHRCTRPYRPQTNGKAERFWRTLNEELLEGTTFERRRSCVRSWGSTCCTPTRRVRIRDWGARRPSMPCRICQRIT